MKIDTDAFKKVIKGHKGQGDNVDDAIKGMFDVDVEYKETDFMVALVHCVPYLQVRE